MVKRHENVIGRSTRCHVELPGSGFCRHTHSHSRPTCRIHQHRPQSLQPVCRTKKKDDSYPSGHATAGYLQALTLIELFPEKRDAILARAADYANNRLVCGLHYRSDIEAARLIAYSVHAFMRENAQFKAEVSAAKAELRSPGVGSAP